MNKANILFFTNWGFLEGLIQSYTLPYIKAIQEIKREGTLYLVTEEKDYKNLLRKDINAVNESLREYRIIWKPKPYSPVGMRKMIQMAVELLRWSIFILKNDIGVLHSLCTPAGVYSYLLSVLVPGKRKLVIDSFEPHTMYMAESGVWSRNSMAYRFLFVMEKKMVNKADYVIATTEGMREFAEKTYQAKNTESFFIKPACVNLETFKYSPNDRCKLRTALHLSDETVVGIYVGKFGGTYLYSEIFEFLKVAYDFWEGNFFLILLSPHDPVEIKTLCSQSGFPYEALLLDKVPHDEVKKFLSAADFGLTPVRPTPSKKYCTPIKDGEYWASGLPVVITKDISDDSDIIEREIGGVVIEDLDVDAYQDAVSRLDTLLKSTSKNNINSRIRSIAERYRNFNIVHNIYAEIYN